jgi:hypothetical protein
MPAHHPSTDPARTPVSPRHVGGSAAEAAAADEVIRLFLHLRHAGYDEATARVRAIYIYSGTHFPGLETGGQASEFPAEPGGITP